MRKGETAVLTIILVIFAIAICMAFLMLFDISGAGSQADTSPIPRPTLPAETPSYKVFMPIVNQHNLTPTPTARPTLEK